MVANPAHGQLKGKMNISLSAFAPENLVSRDEFGSSVPRKSAHPISLIRLKLVLTYGIPPEFRGGVQIFILNRRPPSGQSRVYRVTQLRTDDVHSRVHRHRPGSFERVLP